MLPGIQTPVRIVAGADQVVPRSNAEFLHERLFRRRRRRLVYD
jgi:hypothetical protein